MKPWMTWLVVGLVAGAALLVPVLIFAPSAPEEAKHFGWIPPVEPVEEPGFGWNPPAEVVAGGDGRHFGWTPNPPAVARTVAQLKFKNFSQTPAYRANSRLPAEVFMWQAYRKLNGQLPPSKNQGSIGSCVSFGTNNAVCRTLATAIAFGGANYEFKDVAEEVTYGGGRQQICHQGAGGDGTNGSCCAKFVQKYGVCPREKVADYDLSVYSVPTCRIFGNKGVPKAILDTMAENKVKDITLVKTWQEAKTCLANGWAIAVCSGVGFQSKRDANGVKAASGSWSHCMCLDGYCTINGVEHGHIENSWGDDNSGPTGPGSPSKAGFWAKAATINKMLGAGDSWAFSDVSGFEPRVVNWFVLNRLNDLPRPATLTFGAHHANTFLSFGHAFAAHGESTLGRRVF